MSLNRRPSGVVKITIPTVTGAYASGNQIGTPVEIPDAVAESGGISTLMSLTIQDLAKQDSALSLLIFSQKPAAGTDHAAISVSGADLANLIGVIAISNSYVDLGSVSAASVVNIGLKLRPTKVAKAQSNSSLWALLVSAGTPNYGGNSKLNLVFGLDKD